jgi:hypothetical protein
MKLIQSTEHLQLRCLSYTVLPGTSLEDACKEAQSLADEMNMENIPIEIYDGLILFYKGESDSIQTKIDLYKDCFVDGVLRSDRKGDGE